MFARFISVVLHPVFIPLLGLYVVVKADPYVLSFYPNELVSGIFMVTVICTIVMPALFIFVMRRLHLISDYHMPTHKERLVPYLGTLCFYLVAYYLFRRTNVLPAALYSMFSGILLVLSLIILISLRWKISSHSAGFFGLIGALCGVFSLHGISNLYLLSALILMGGMLMSARLQMQAHSLSQVLFGAVLGFAGVFFPVVLGVFL